MEKIRKEDHTLLFLLFGMAILPITRPKLATQSEGRLR
jgi:hypothetical protein